MDDSGRLFAWRNDPETRSASHEEVELDYKSHCDWLRRSLAMSTRTVYIAEVDGLPVGTVRADRGSEATRLSWTVAPEQRGRGLGTAMVGAALKMLAGTLSAEVKCSNLASRRIAERVGFQLACERDGVLHYVRHAGAAAPL